MGGKPLRLLNQRFGLCLASVNLHPITLYAASDERGPALLDDGKVAFTNYLPPGRDRQRGFLVRASWLSSFMTMHNLELVAASYTLRWRVTGDHNYSPDHDPERDDRLDVYAAARIDPELGLSLASPIRMLNHNELDGTRTQTE